MKMTCLVGIVIMLVTLGSSSHGVEGEYYGRFRMLDETGGAISNAVVGITFYKPKPHGQGPGQDMDKSFRLHTDANGECAVKGTCKGDIFAGASKDGYYGYAYGYVNLTNYISGRFEPWGALTTMPLRKVIDPIPMYAGRVRRGMPAFKIPVMNASVGFDLVKADWVTPYGHGETADFIFRMDNGPIKVGVSKFGGRYEIFDTSLTISFSNDGDGIQSYRAKYWEGSLLRLPGIAPAEGYERQWAMRFRRENADSPIVSNMNRDDRNYFFRVRTVKKDGKIESACYGKIYGDFYYFWNGHMEFHYYLNPDPHSRNVEFDLKRNLLPANSPMEPVSEP